MKTKFLMLIMMSYSFFGFAQNLVPNSSFESYFPCPSTVSQFNVLSDWTIPNIGSSDYFNACAPIGSWSVNVPNNLKGVQSANTGTGYAGIYLTSLDPFSPIAYREYLQVQLTSTLTAGQQYLVQFYWSLADSSSHSVQEIGVYFSAFQINYSQPTNLLYTPQVEQVGTPLNNSSGWSVFQQIYTATGNENYLIIGNFRDIANTTLDSTGVPCSLIECFAYYYIDDVSVSISTNVTELSNFTGVTLFPNPNNGQFTLNVKGFDGEGEIKVFNMVGQQVYHYSGTFTEHDIDLTQEKNSLYIVKYSNDNGQFVKRIVKQ